jgi:hypothetical protein
MQLKIKPIEKDGFLELLFKVPAVDRKWLISLLHDLNSSQKYYIAIDEFTQDIIGLTYCIPINGLLDFSLIIFPEYQRHGYGENLIFHLLSNYDNTTFTVSKSNRRMLNLLEKLHFKNRLSVNYIDFKTLQFKQCKNKNRPCI